ncbi:unnamed protein product, partial [Ectocarpus fasciculatus]
VAESSSDDIPVNFDAREAFPECASVIGRVRDQSDCGSCWAFASTEVRIGRSDRGRAAPYATQDTT